MHGSWYLKLHDTGFVDLGILEHVEVEGTAEVDLLLLIPDVACNPKLEGIHAAAVVLQLLVSILSCVVIVLSILVANIQPYTICLITGRGGGEMGVPENSVSKAMNSATFIDSTTRGSICAKFSLVTSIK